MKKRRTYLKAFLVAAITAVSSSAWSDSILGPSPNSCGLSLGKQDVSCEFTDGQTFDLTFFRGICVLDDVAIVEQAEKDSFEFNTEKVPHNAVLKLNGLEVPTVDVNSYQPQVHNLYEMAIVVCNGKWDDWKSKCVNSTLDFTIYPYRELDGSVFYGGRYLINGKSHRVKSCTTKLEILD